MDKNKNHTLPKFKEETHPVQQEIFRNMSPEDKLNMSLSLYWSARKLKAAALKSQYPGWSEEKIEKKVKEIFMYATT